MEAWALSREDLSALLAVWTVSLEDMAHVVETGGTLPADQLRDIADACRRQGIMAAEQVNHVDRLRPGIERLMTEERDAPGL